MAECLKWAHPMRTNRLGWAHMFNPFAYAIDMAATLAKTTRAPLDSEDAWVKSEAVVMDACSAVLDQWRLQRDATAEALFATLYPQGQAS
jgi:hypothetical protein